jgi:uroporphyrinogen decarboxylase
MDSRERILRALRHEEPDRVPITDSLWAETIWRWQREGMPPEQSPEDYFDYEMVGFGFDLSPLLEIATLHKDDKYIVERTAFGGVRKNLRTFASTPEIIDWPVKSRADWEKLKPRVQGKVLPDFVRADWVNMRHRYQRARSEGKATSFATVVGYDYLQSYIKSEELLMIMMEDPAWFRDMVETAADLTLRLAKMFFDAGFEPDVAFLYNDMAYVNGPLFSPKMYRELIMPSDRMLCDFFHERGMPVLYHTDGDIRPFLPSMIEAGVNCLQPLEAKAKMDVRQLKGEYGDKLTFMGNIDARLMSCTDEAKLEDEIASKLEVAKKGGGYIYHSDHSVPPDVSFEQYCRVLEFVKKHGQY